MRDQRRWLVALLASAWLPGLGCHVNVRSAEADAAGNASGRVAGDGAPTAFGTSPSYVNPPPASTAADGVVRIPPSSKTAAPATTGSSPAATPTSPSAGYVTDLPSWARRRHEGPADEESGDGSGGGAGLDPLDGEGEAEPTEAGWD
jgi:hypothetical protein